MAQNAPDTATPTADRLHIFIPYWGDEDLLFEAVESVLAQDDARWLLTVIDDCYPSDRVAPYFGELADERVSYLRNTENIGITENFRKSVAMAQTPYVTVLGSDDRLLPNYVRTILAAIDAHPDADVVEPGVRVIDETGARSMPLVDRVKAGILRPRTRGERVVLKGERMASSLIRGNWLYWPSLALRTERVRRIDFRDGFPIIQDLGLLMDIAFDDGTLVYDPQVSFEYRRHSDSASQKTVLDGRRFDDERRYFALARDLAKGMGWPRTAGIASRRLFSRLHALSALPVVLLRGTAEGRRSVLLHVFGS
jgi:glycosyltransferase involved in cell wall biosynthesis